MVKLNYKIINDLQGGEKTIFKPSFSGLDKGVKHKQIIFGSVLNDEEKKSVISRLEKGSNNTQLKQYEEFLDLSWEAILECNSRNKKEITQEDLNCYHNKLYEKLRTYIVSNPAYQEQCKDEI